MSTATTHDAGMELFAITTGVETLLARVQAFREAHPVGHAPCAACDHLRHHDERYYPAGPSDVLAALHVSLWKFNDLLGEIGVPSLIDVDEATRV